MEIFKLIIFAIILFLMLVRVPNVIKLTLVILILIAYQVIFAELGNDYKEYHTFYSTLSEKYNFELGFEWLVIISNSIGLSFIQFYTSLNLFLICSMFYCFRLYVRNIFYVILPYVSFMYYSLQINAIRQAIAVLIFTFSFKFLVSGSKAKYTFLIFVASLFHRSAIFLLPLIFIKKFLKLSHNVYAIAFFIALVLYVSNVNIFDILISNMINTLPEVISNKFKYYTIGSDLLSEARFGVGFLDRIILFFVTYFIMYSYDKKGNMTEETLLLANLIMWYILLQIVFFEYNFLFQRVKYYFFPFIFILWARFLSDSFRLFNKMILFLFIIVYSFFNVVVKL